MNIPSQFPLDLALNILSVLIMVVLVRLLAYKPVRSFLDKRKEKIDKTKEEAERALENAHRSEEEYEAALADAESAAEKRAAEVIAEAKKKAEAIVSEANERADKVLSLAEAKIKADREAALEGIEKETVSLALEIAEKILERRVTDSDTINMAQKFFKESAERKG